MSYTTEIVAKMLAGVLAFLLAIAAGRAMQHGAQRHAAVLCALAGLLGVAAFLNFGTLRHARDDTFVNQWEHFHYQLGSKYFPELGYDGLYLASLGAQHETHPGSAIPPLIRDLRRNRLMRVSPEDPEVDAVRDRFDPERWQAFLADHANYVERNSPSLMAQLRRDHGYNPSPTWTFVARLFSARLTSSTRNLRLLASLDLLAMALAFAVVFAICGLRTAGLAVALFGLTYGVRYVYLGSFLRLDWLAAVLVSLCMLKRERPGWAGVFLGYATALRAFPAVFLVGPALLAAKALLRREFPGWAVRLGAGFTVSLLLGVAAGSLTGRGLPAWSEFAGNLELHRQTWAPTRVGLDALVLHAPALAGSALEHGSLPRYEMPSLGGIERRLRARRPATLVLKGAGVALTLAASWRASLPQASVLGMALLFFLTTSGSYYWVMLCAVPLALRHRATLATLALGPILYGVELLYPEYAMNHMRYAWMSVGLAALLLYWVVPEARRVVRPDSVKVSGS